MKLKTTTLLLLLYLTSYSTYAEIFITYPKGVKIYEKIAHLIGDKIKKSTEPSLRLHKKVYITTDKRMSIEDTSEKNLIINIGKIDSPENSLNKSNSSILYTFTTRKKLSVLTNNKNINPWSAVVIDQPLQSLIDAAEKTIRQNYKNTILIIVSEKNKFSLEKIKNIKKSGHAKIRTLIIKENDIAAKVIEKDLPNTAAIIAIHDKSTWSGNNAKWILRQAYTYKIPVIGYSKAFLKAGAMISVYSSADQIIAATEKRIIEWAETGKLDNKITSPDYQIEVNKNIAKALKFRSSTIKKIERKEK